MTYSSDRILQHIETQAYNVLDAYFDNTVTHQMGGGEFKGGVREHALFIEKQFSDIMAGGADCDTPVIANPNSSFLPPLEAAVGESMTLDANLPVIPVHAAVRWTWPFPNK
jgi:hypothetical protein